MRFEKSTNMQSNTKQYDLSCVLDDVIFPNWMAICRKIESKYNLHVDGAQRLYHYTSLDGFQSIMQKRDFWISNIRYMNDSQEFENGKAICKEVIKTKLCTYDRDEMRRYFQGLLKVCDQSASQGFHVINSREIFSLSFCNSGDILTQWQFYGKEMAYYYHILK